MIQRDSLTKQLKRHSEIFMVLSVILFPFFLMAETDLDPLLDSLRVLSKNKPTAGLKYGFHLLETKNFQKAPSTEAFIKIELATILNHQGLPAQGLDYYLEGVSYLERHRADISTAWHQIDIGNIYFHQKNYGEAETAYRKALAAFRQKGPFWGEVTALNNLGLLHQEKNSPEAALDYFLKAMRIRQLQDKDSTVIAQSYLYLAEQLRQMERHSEADYYEEKLLKMDISDTLYHRRAQISLNRARLFWRKGELLKAKENLTLAEKRYFDDFSKREAVGFYRSCALFYMENGDAGTARHYLDKALTLSREHALYRDQIETLRQIMRMEEKSRDFIRFSGWLQQIDSLQNIIHQTDLERSMRHAEAKLTLEAHKRALTEQEAALKLAIFYRNGALLFGMMLCLLLWMLYWRYQYKKRTHAKILAQQTQIHNQEKALLDEQNRFLEAERNHVKNELESKRRELIGNALKVMQGNDLVKIFIEKLDHFGKNLDEDDTLTLQKIINEFNKNNFLISWEEFEKRFEALHTDFYKKLTHDFPDLSPNERKLCAYFRLDMSNKDIATLAFTNYETIKKAKYRLRKSLNLHPGEKLLHFLMKY
jgi:tetratricopeptide (TPR) repeat protein